MTTELLLIRFALLGFQNFHNLKQEVKSKKQNYLYLLVLVLGLGRYPFFYPGYSHKKQENFNILLPSLC